jgi:hypothetical protein
MKVPPVSLVYCVALSLVGCSSGQQFGNILNSWMATSSVAAEPRDPSLHAQSPDQIYSQVIHAANALDIPADVAYRTALRLAWEAAVTVKNPPHEQQTWQQARVKWRMAVRLLESVPDSSDYAPAAQKRLVVYRKNYQIMRDRLQAEQAAADNLATAQQRAAQAARMVQEPPQPLQMWQRANRRWQQAIDLLATAPANTSYAPAIRQKLVDYRRNQAAIQQRLATETQALSVLRRFAEVSTQLKTLSEQALGQGGLDSVGLSVQDYAQLVDSLATQLAQSAQRSKGQIYRAYPELAATLRDYRVALKLWQSHLAEQQHPEGLAVAYPVPQLVGVSRQESEFLTQTYGVKTYRGGTKVSLRFAVWEIWRSAGHRVGQAQQKALGIKATSEI